MCANLGLYAAPDRKHCWPRIPTCPIWWRRVRALRSYPEFRSPSIITQSGPVEHRWSVGLVITAMSRVCLLRMLQQNVRCHPPAVAGSSSSTQALISRFFAEDASLDRGEKVLVKGREAAEKLDEAKGSVKETADESSEKAKSVIDSATEHTKKEMHTAGEMVKDIPGKAMETAQGLKEVGVEAAKALKRDTEKIAEKVGIKEKKPGDLDKTES